MPVGSKAVSYTHLIRREVNKAMRELSNYRYDPKKYEERGRERRAWEADSGRDVDDG